jgi:hypothetical protein
MEKTHQTKTRPSLHPVIQPQKGVIKKKMTKTLKGRTSPTYLRNDKRQATSSSSLHMT